LICSGDPTFVARILFARHSSESWNPARDVMKNPCVYILASGRSGTLYIGVTSDLIARIWQHKNDVVEGFTKRYSVHTLVWFEQHATMESAITREKAIKAWKRSWKVELIEAQNPDWRDLYAEIA
jgi:putative endonuclease